MNDDMKTNRVLSDRESAFHRSKGWFTDLKRDE